jgi:hypothetical protein
MHSNVLKLTVRETRVSSDRLLQPNLQLKWIDLQRLHLRGHRICAAVQRNSIMATQFHPERSGEVGLSIMRRYLEI